MLQVGSSWTTLPAKLPPHVGEHASINSSIVYKNKRLVIVGANTTTRESGVVLKTDHGGWSQGSTLPGLGTGGRYTFIASGQVLSPTSPILLSGKHMYAVISNPKNYRKNAQGYAVGEELFRAPLKEYLSKGLLDNAMDFIGGLYSCIAGGSNSQKDAFWRPIAEMEELGACVASCVDAHGTTIMCAVGGYQTLSPKFYQVFSAKERVSRAARILRIDQDGSMDSGWNRLPDMNSRRKNMCTVIVGSYLYAIGGQDDTGKTLASAERLNLSLGDAGFWEPVAPMKTPRHGFAVTTTPSGIIVVAGGCNSSNGRLDSVECLVHTPHDNNQEWKALPRLQMPRMNASLSIVNSKLVVTGGTKTPGPFWGTGNLDTIETLDIVTSVVDTLPPTVPLPALPPSTTAPTACVPPVAHAEVLFDEGCDEHGFVPVIHAPPTAPSHWHRPTSVASIPAEAVLVEPTVPAARQASAPEHRRQQQSSSSSSSAASLPTPIPPPQDKGASQELETTTATPLPPPVMPPAVASMPAAGASSSVQRSDDDLSCAVCLERKKQVAFFCGHQVCLVCSPQLQECHICRKPIEGRIQLFGD